MCDPLTLAGIALTVGSTGLNYAASQRVAAARDDATLAESLRQKKLDREATNVNQSTRKEYKRFEKDARQRSDELSDYFTDQEAQAPKEAQLPTSASNVTVQEEAKQRAASKDFTNKTGEALGELRSFGDLLGDKSIMQAQDATRVGQLGGFKTASSNVLGYELEDANHEGDGLKLFADLASGLGGLTMARGLSMPGVAPVKPFVANTTLGDLLGQQSNMAAARMADLRSVPGYAALF